MNELTLLDQVALQILPAIIHENRHYPAVMLQAYEIAEAFIAEKKRRDDATK